MWLISARYRRFAQVADVLATAFSFLAAWLVWQELRRWFPSLPLGRNMEISSDTFFLIVFMTALWLLILNKQGAYSVQRFSSFWTDVRVVLGTVIWGGFCLAAYIVVIRPPYIPRTLIATFCLINALCLVLQKRLYFYLAVFYRKRGKNRRKLLIVGWNSRTRQLLEMIERSPNWGLDVVGILTANDGPRDTGNYPALGGLNRLADVLHERLVQEVIITLSTKDFAGLRAMLDTCEREGVQTRIISDFFGSIAKHIQGEVVGGLPIITIRHTSDYELQLFCKRAMDILGSAILLSLLAPLFLALALAIKLTSRGPVFYAQDRVGLGGKAFRFYKFRSMTEDAERRKAMLLDHNEMDGAVFKMKNDPRVTGIGRLLRRFSMDELPQLWHVLKGEMSLVGPRPPMAEELPNFESWQRRKLSMKPGLTCIWQVEGRNRISDFDEWVRMDLTYIDNWSLWLDLKLLLRTIPVIITGKGAY